MTSEEMSGDVAVTAQGYSDAASAEQPRGEQPPGDAIESAANGGPDDQADGGGDTGQVRDPWFEPEPTTAPPQMAGQQREADRIGSGVDYPDSRQAEWFLPTGRAGLLPDSMTESWDDDEPQESPAHTAAAGAPPWAAEEPSPAASSPPPWESGPWPGPGAAGTGGALPAGAGPGGADTSHPGPGAGGLAGQADPAFRAAANGGAIPVSRNYGIARRAGTDVRIGTSSRVDDSPSGGSSGQLPSRQALTAVIAGIVPLVVPGLVLGILGVRRSGQSGEGGADRLAYWTAIALSVVWACVIAVIVATGSGSPAAGCVGYPASVRAAYAKVISDINAKAPAAAQAADLAGAATKANAAAADTSQIQARDALFRLVSDLEQVQADVVNKHPVPEDVLASLRADGATFPQSCPG